VPSARLVTRASLPSGDTDMSLAPLPALNVCTTFGGAVFRSNTETRSSSMILSGLAGSILLAAVTMPQLSSGETQIDVGAPTTLVGASKVAISRGGNWARSTTETVSGGAFLAGPETPLVLML